MFAKIKELKYVRNDWALREYIKHGWDSISDNLLKSLPFVDDLTKDDVFVLEDYISIGDGSSYYIIKNEKGYFMTRDDNLDYYDEPQDILENYGYEKLIKSGNKTILISQDRDKWIVTRDEQDEDDPLKAVMMLILKSCGYSIDEIYLLAETLK